MMKENWVYCRGDIYCANLDPVVGSEQGGIRPVIVIQNDTGNKHAPTLIVATVTTRIHKKANMPTHFVIYDNPAFKEASVVQLEQIRTIDKSRIDNYLGKVMLGVHRQTIYYIVANEDFELIKVGRYKRATKESFEKWYQNQTRYQLAEDRQERS